MLIYLVEDDHLQADWVKEALQTSLRATVSVISSEREFVSKVDEIATTHPDCLVIDVMLRWTDPSPDMELPPQDVIDQGFYKAGLRCKRLVQQKAELKDVPVVLYTNLEQDDIVEDSVLTKESSVDNLVREIRKVTKAK